MSIDGYSIGNPWLAWRMAGRRDGLRDGWGGRLLILWGGERAARGFLAVALYVTPLRFFYQN